MPLRRLHRRLLATLLAFCVIFAQSAALAYACQRTAPDTQQGSLCATHLAEQAGPDDRVPLAEGNVCEVHCEPASLPDAGIPDLPGPAAIVAWHLPSGPGLPVRDAPPAELEARSTSPPARTLFARLLI